MADDVLFEVVRQYACLSPVNAISLPKDISNTVLQDFLVKELLEDQHLKVYPPSQQYQRTFWKKIVAHLERTSIMPEDEEFEISSVIYDHYLGLLNPNNDSSGSSSFVGQGPPSKSFVTYFWKAPGLTSSERFLKTTLLESRNMIESGTTGLRTWTASFVLAQYLIDHPDVIVRKNVLELGAGIGFTGIVASAIQVLAGQDSSNPNKIWLTDVEDTVLATCRDNVDLPCNTSSTHGGVKTQQLDWYAALDENRRPEMVSLLHRTLDPDVIIGADIVFDPSLIGSLLATLEIALRSTRATFALIALTRRNPETMAKFMSSAIERGFTVDAVEYQNQHISFLPHLALDTNLKDVKILRFVSS
ncbi:hypothetical protein CC1G_00543 [Coprinopsis cinerea okayama7|uniref:FAM86 N-terminal domain-containing protein n=1 Tax=Coprinopsis cinerea (strain Okayama-7 / 130 / ATCC MYA-4618 / FGSC 9003) TaxID=240176 RepID=A8N3B9_COPC7|nr:hypothetical protein CC1G_00543 [Coprinopsis cinerea okayama7\|eukprot:XP_001829364.2 hypothetical protein CC1G_00543 [Coprinopsis cinerea okayama7\